MPDALPSRDQIASDYFDQLRFEPYPVQEEALLAWFTSDEGLLVCAPTGTGKTLIAEAALYDALRTGKRVYYTTPLIALTDQKFTEFQDAAIRWGFGMSKVGLVTGNRRVNPDAPVLVVVAEILLNRLLSDGFDLSDVSAVVMDEFHSFNDPERGIVWEFTLGLLPQHVRLLLLSATVGNAMEFLTWLERRIDQKLQLIQGSERQVPLSYHWVGDALLAEQLEEMAKGDEASRRIPALVFCFNREQCWNVAEQLKGKRLLADGQQDQLAKELTHYDWSQGAGPKLRQVLLRGIGVHHAGVLPRYRRIVEDLFQRKLLSVTICTETLAAGVNLPARSVVVPNLMKGPPGKKKVMEPSAAHQMFGRAGRPQFDTEGHIFALAHEDDVKILRWREKFDQIPENTKDPGLRKAKKALKRKMPKRRANEQYWTEQQFQKLTQAEPARLRSQGPVPWRLLAHMLQISPDVERLRTLVGKRLMDNKHLAVAQKDLDRMLMVLWKAGYVDLEPAPPKQQQEDAAAASAHQQAAEASREEPPAPAPIRLIFGRVEESKPTKAKASPEQPPSQAPPAYQPMIAHPKPSLDKLLMLRGINPLYGMFLINQMGIADRGERIQAMESVLELPGSVRYHLRVPPHDQLPPGPLAVNRLDVQLLQLGLASAEELGAAQKEDDDEDRYRNQLFQEDRVWVLTLADKLRRLFDYEFPGVHDVRTQSVWAAGEVLEYGGDFNKYITSKALQKQEGIIFRHLLRLILLANEFTQFCPPDDDPGQWRADMEDIAARLAETCRNVDPASTDKTLEEVGRQVDDSRS